MHQWKVIIIITISSNEVSTYGDINAWKDIENIEDDNISI